MKTVALQFIADGSNSKIITFSLGFSIMEKFIISPFGDIIAEFDGKYWKYKNKNYSYIRIIIGEENDE